MEDGHWDIPEYGYTECLRKYFSNAYHSLLSHPLLFLTPFEAHPKFHTYIPPTENAADRRIKIVCYYVNIGQVEYAQRTAWTTMGIICAVLIPVTALVAAAFLYIRKNQSRGGSVKSWRYSERGSGVDNESTLFTRTALLKTYDRPISPASDSSTATSTIKKPHSYDKVYRTHEPLPNRPDVDFEDKDWDLKEPNSPTDSEKSMPDSIRKAGSPTKESDVWNGWANIVKLLNNIIFMARSTFQNFIIYTSNLWKHLFHDK